jgi:uncharacterized membrane protein YdcZ (DUF606 family)
VALVCAIWFAITGWIWTWLFAIFFSYPVGLIALLIYLFERRKNPENSLNNKILWILIAGWIASILAMLLFK